MNLLLGIGTLLLAVSASGDWLVTRDGTRIQTIGPWEVKGSQVIFNLPGGRLSALRLADVDLEASDAATAESQAAPPEPADPPVGTKRRAVLRLTDEDLRPQGANPEAEDEDEGDGKTDDQSDVGDDVVAPDEDPEEPVKLVTWNEGEAADSGGLEITGSVRNTGSGMAVDIRVTVTVLDDEDSPYVRRADLATSSLAPGRTSTFRAPLPGIYALKQDPTFEVESEGFTIHGPDLPEGEEHDRSEGERDDGR